MLILAYRDAPAITATVNCLPTLVKTRTTIANKILNAVLAFNPLAHGGQANSYRDRFIAKSLEKTVRTMLIHLVRYEYIATTPEPIMLGVCNVD